MPRAAPPGGARGPGHARDGVFFNPASAFARDLSVLYLAAVARPGMAVLDGLTGVGARAARWRREVPGEYRITANDRSPQAIDVARRNLAADDRRSSAGVRLLQRPLGALLAEERFDLIDLDAPGSPAPFLDAACQSLRSRPPGGDRSHLLVTATDTMALSGAQPGVCRRRYGAWPLRGELGHEVAVRILVGAIVRAAARSGLAATPALTYARGHWYGTYVRLRSDDRSADAALDALGYALLCPSCWDRRVVPGRTPPEVCAGCGRPVRIAGPLWTGPLWDAVMLRRLLADDRPLASGPEVRTALAGWLAEAEAPALFYDLQEAARHLGRAAMPRLEIVRQRLAAFGHTCVRTHFGRVGIKTDASTMRVLDAIGGDERPDAPGDPADTAPPAG